MRTRNPQALAAAAKSAALELGFEAAGICDLAPFSDGALRRWLDAGYAATMAYLPRQAARRTAPARIVVGAQRAVVVLLSYRHPPPASAGAARVAQYAWGEDYHRVVGDKLAVLRDALLRLGATPAATRAYVDAGPVPERALAQRAGLGWLAKNTMLIHPRLGSFTFIGAVLTDLELAMDAPFPTDHCGSCRACLDACPTDAFAAARQLDARRCISYLTIERRGPFSADDGARLGEWLFGCDVCQDVCPWNEKFAAPTREPRFAPRPELVAPDLDELRQLDDATFAARYADTAFERPGQAGLARNAAQVIANRGNSPQRHRGTESSSED
ncbi:MAG: tRNA epoxyqueuosine(34) reductase QueG [Deltaproteobacteria bacterium]|nr:tRNA epoxyqueuosine(34) reductase QueG [Deltaproteobacteria bacterium]